MRGPEQGAAFRQQQAPHGAGEHQGNKPSRRRPRRAPVSQRGVVDCDGVNMD